MSDMRRIAAISQELERQNSRLLVELRKALQKLRSLEKANANLRVELEAADMVLGAAMDELLMEGTPDA